ncbi:MAG: DUF5320 domain-containing protein [Spirochaetota bacterium]
MPVLNGTGPQGYGPMTGRSMGRCAGGACFGVPGYGMGIGCGFGRGRGAGYGSGRGLRPGRGLGWFATGYQDVGERAAGANIRNALETRIAALRTELARTEDLLGVSNTDPESGEDTGEDTGK